ncbi:MAG: hypothetical protein BV456_11160 [Thermoplasmata archaeon M8B2D]|nr:MAG: hypothetical protein BV456_11160 [Thermoplasmata archaeon M8B2D]
MNDYYEELINQDFEKIMKKLEGGKLYGTEIDVYNIKHLVVAAYAFALLEKQDLWVEKWKGLLDDTK